MEQSFIHTCRRSYVTNCLDKGMKLALVSRNVGHRNESTILNPLNIAEAPKTADSAALKASLGEDKYFLIF